MESSAQVRTKLTPKVLSILAFAIVGVLVFIEHLDKIAYIIIEGIPVGTPEQPIRLNASEIEKLIVNKTEIGKLVQPTHSEFEGRPNTWYGAFYFEDNRMLYRRAVARSYSNWEWYIDSSNNLCRGPVNSCTRSCRSIENIGKGYYRAVGFRTGKVRYIFRLKEEQPKDLSKVDDQEEGQ